MELSFARDITRASMQTDLDIEVRDEYSGRGMYGRSTAAIVCSSWADFAAAAVLLAAEQDPHRRLISAGKIADQIAKLTSDSMGRDSIVIY
jgi:hypothetical protein